MKHAKRVHTKGSKKGNDNQPQTALASTESFARKLTGSARALSKLIHYGEKSDAADHKRLCIMRGAVLTIIDQAKDLVGGMAAALPQAVAPNAYEPFGSLKPTSKIEMARHHLDEAWNLALAKTIYYDGGSSLRCLYYCTEHNPGLRTENSALAAIGDGLHVLHNFYVGFENCKKPEEQYAASEVWLARQLISREETDTLAQRMVWLEGLDLVFKSDPRMAKLANAIRGIIRGKSIMVLLRRWIDNIPLPWPPLEATKGGAR